MLMISIGHIREEWGEAGQDVKGGDSLKGTQRAVAKLAQGKVSSRSILALTSKS